MKYNKKIIIPVCIFIALIVACCLGINITLIGDKEVYLNINDEYFDNGYIATFFGKEINNVKESNNIDNKTFGTYEAKYQVSFILPLKTVKRKVVVADIKKPSIELIGEETVYLSRYEDYIEAGYKAIDNYDGDITEKVQVENNINTNEEGTYYVSYTVLDNAGNKESRKRTVEVKATDLLNATIEEFWLDGCFKDVILEPGDKEYDYFKDTVFIGDSNTYFMYTIGRHIDKNQCWGKSNLNIAQINSSVFITFEDNKERTLSESIDLFKPKYLIVNPGINCPLFVDKDTYVNEINKFIEYMRSNYPDIKFAFSGILPICLDGTLYTGLQDKINKYNYYLAETCHNNKVNLIYFSDEIRGENGYGIKEMFDFGEDNNKGFHLSHQGKDKYVDYVKHLDLERIPE